MKKKDILKLALMGLALGCTMTSCSSGGGPQQDDQGSSSCSGKTSCSGKQSCSGKSSCGGDNTGANETPAKAQASLKQKRESAAKEMC
jgi:hypothetical protein